MKKSEDQSDYKGHRNDDALRRELNQMPDDGIWWSLESGPEQDGMYRQSHGATTASRIRNGEVTRLAFEFESKAKCASDDIVPGNSKRKLKDRIYRVSVKRIGSPRCIACGQVVPEGKK